jgi:hypothetical protein
MPLSRLCWPTRAPSHPLWAWLPISSLNQQNWLVFWGFFSFSFLIELARSLSFSCRTNSLWFETSQVIRKKQRRLKSEKMTTKKKMQCRGLWEPVLLLPWEWRLWPLSNWVYKLSPPHISGHWGEVVPDIPFLWHRLARSKKEDGEFGTLISPTEAPGGAFSLHPPHPVCSPRGDCPGSPDLPDRSSFKELEVLQWAFFSLSRPCS